MLNFVVLFDALSHTCFSYNVAGHSYQGGQMLTGERLQIIWAEFFNFSKVRLFFVLNALHGTHTHAHI